MLFATLRQMVADGRTVIFISHKLNEVKAVSDRVTVLRGGRSVATVAMAEATPRSLAALMVGRELADPVREARPDPGEPMLEVDDLWVAGSRGESAVRGVSLVVRAGEIVAVAGVAGNGQRELAEAIAGLRAPERGAITVAGRSFTSATRRRRSAPESPSSRRTGWRPGRRPGSASPRISCFAPTATRRSRAGRCSCSGASASAPFGLIERYRIATPGPDAAGAPAFRRQPPEGRDRPRVLGQPACRDRRLPDPGSRRRRHRDRSRLPSRRGRRAAPPC